MTPEERARQAVDYLLMTDALTRSDYRPEIEAEIVRCMKDAAVNTSLDEALNSGDGTYRP